MAQQQSTWSSVTESLDLLGETHSTAISSEKQTINSGLGAICSVLIFVVVSLFTYQKAEILMYNKEMRLVEIKEKNHFDGSEVFTAQDGLALAFGLNAVIDPTYFTIIAESNYWGFDEQGEPTWSLEPIKTHRCSLEELGLTPDKSLSKFYKATPLRIIELQAYADLY